MSNPRIFRRYLTYVVPRFKNMVGKPIGIATLTAKGVYRRRQTLVAISILEY